MKWVLICLLVLAAAGCGGQARQASRTDSNGPGDGSPGKIVMEDCLSEAGMRVGDTLAIRFLEYPGRGYSWMLSGPDSALRFLSLVSVERVQLADLDGAPDRVEFLFAGVRVGKESLRFVYLRPWERNKPPFDSCRVTVIVRN